MCNLLCSPALKFTITPWHYLLCRWMTCSQIMPVSLFQLRYSWCGSISNVLSKNRFFCISVPKTVSLIIGECWFSLAPLVNPCWILSYFIFLSSVTVSTKCCSRYFHPTELPGDSCSIFFRPHLLLCCFILKPCSGNLNHAQIICNPSFFLYNNATNIVLTLSICAVLGICLGSVLLAD